jgi:ribose 5-phosphate isomerase RpiB
MKIAVIQASTQIDKNSLLYEETKRATQHLNADVYHFGVTDLEENFSYIQIALCIGLLINTKSLDYVISGCSSGNGMAIACNSLPNVICGYLPTPNDAYLFGRITRGNCASLPLGLNFGWAGELNIRFILEKLFEEPLDIDYPKEAATRKLQDANTLKMVKKYGQTNMMEILTNLPTSITRPIFVKRDLMEFILQNGEENELLKFCREKFAQ